MLTLLITLWFLSFLFLLIGLIKPNLLRLIKVPPSRKTVLIYFGIPCFLLLFGIGAFAPKMEKRQEPVRKIGNIEDQAAKHEDLPKEENKVQSKVNNEKDRTVVTNYIPGITPVDVYGNFEKKGFKTHKEISAEGSFFYSDLSENGIDSRVTIYCENGVTKITSVRLSATRMQPQYNKVIDMKAFLKYGCSIPCDGADVQKIEHFIDENYYKNNASIVISGVRFTIYVPTEFVRIVDIVKE